MNHVAYQQHSEHRKTHCSCNLEGERDRKRAERFTCEAECVDLASESRNIMRQACAQCAIQIGLAATIAAVAATDVTAAVAAVAAAVLAAAAAAAEPSAYILAAG